IQTGLLPRLDAIRAGTTLLTEELAHDRDADRGVVQRVRDEVTAIQGVIRRLTRGLSLLADAEDDFATALEQLRTSLPPGSPPLQVAVES
ncbi:hypothetical protein, partial [Pseudomonas sp. FW306-02-F08-AA]|uniref:hypothetical protein n=1 Tax=Pseudomonas sp. FW306-02-F08-AA TaxID=2070651 RepID=UPI000CC83A7A